MITLVLSSCPASLRGHLTRWLNEISANVFVGKVNPRIREKLWSLVLANIKNGKAIMTYPTRETEQGYDFKIHNHDWAVVELDGIKLIQHPTKGSIPSKKQPKAGWSRVGRKRRYG